MPREMVSSFFRMARGLGEKGIAQDFILKNIGILREADAEKEGLEALGSFEAKKEWLYYCVAGFKGTPSLSIQKYSHFFIKEFNPFCNKNCWGK